MKNFTWLKSRPIVALIAAVVGAVIGATITGADAYRIFQKQLLMNQNAFFAEDIQAAVKSHSMWKAVENDDARKSELKKEAELYLNRAWSRALVTLPDPVFIEINKMIKRGTMSRESRNRVYHLLRKQLYPKTKIDYDDIMTTNIEIKE